MEPKLWIEIAAASAIPIGIVSVIYHRVKLEFGIGVQAIQFLGLCIIAPVILILGLEGVLEHSAIGALVGTLLGYLFSNIGKYDEAKARQSSQGAK